MDNSLRTLNIHLYTKTPKKIAFRVKKGAGIPYIFGPMPKSIVFSCLARLVNRHTLHNQESQKLLLIIGKTIMTIILITPK